MGNQAVSSLKDGHEHARGELSFSGKRLSAKKTSGPKTAKTLLSTLFSEEIAEELKNIPTKTIRDAWYISAHLLLDDGAHVIDMGCERGEMAFVLSHIKPNWTITAIDSDIEAINHAKKNYKRENLTFVQQDASKYNVKNNSYDAIICSFLLHEIYSEANFNIRRVRETLSSYYAALKNDGLMFIRDYTAPKHDDYILMELNNEPSRGDNLDDLSEADLLIWFAENVRSGDALKTGGFYMEELPARFPNTRLFRLPHKWACEFVIRKSNTALLEEDLYTEYAFATHRELRQELKSIGSRIVYCSSNWDDDFVKKHMIDHFKLYKENGDPIGYPETSYTMLIQKINKKESTSYQEWRTSRNKPNNLTIKSVRNNETGTITDIVSRHLDLTDVIPFYEDKNGEIRIFLQDSIPRSISNTVPRQGTNIDGRYWSGHMVESISFNAEDIRKVEANKNKAISKFIKSKLGLNIYSEAEFFDGPATYPDPKTIDERTDTKYIEVQSNNEICNLESLEYSPPEGTRFNTIGKLKEYGAQEILDAISVGLIPNARLEIQIFKLYYILKKKPKKHSDTPLVLSELDIKERLDIKDTLTDMAEEKIRFSPVKTPAGNLRLVHSVFMEEGHDEQGGITDISSREQDFFIAEENSQNIAVVIPMAKDLNGEAMMGIIKEHAPVPERFQGNGTMLNVPSFALPSHIDDMESAKRYVAEMFDIEHKYVGKIGEPYFQHIGMTPKKVFPFAVTNMTGKMDYEHFSLTAYAPLNSLYIITYEPLNRNSSTDLFLIVSEAYHLLSDNEQSLSPEFSKDLYAQYTSTSFHDSDFLINSSQSTSSSDKKPQVS